MFRAQAATYLVTFHYSGWVLFCPVLVSGLTDPYVHPRWRWLAPVLTLALWLDVVLSNLKSLTDPANEVGWTFRRVRRLRAALSLRCEK